MRAWILLLVPGLATAEPIGEDDAPPVANEGTGNEPAPGAESGRVDEPEGDSTLRVLGRGALFVPKLALEAAFAPVRGGLWVYERYHLRQRAIDLFFNDARTIGLYPVAELQSGYGINVGARFEHRDLFGQGERLKLHAGTGGRYSQIYSAKARTGDRFGERVAIEAEARFERRPKDAFYGIGNADVDRVSGAPIAEARFREQLARASMIADARTLGDFHVRGSAVIADFTFDRSDEGPPIDELFPMQTMAGWNGIRHGYGELELCWDTRRTSTSWEGSPVWSTGWLLSAFAGRTTALGAGSDYWRYGVDLQRFLRLGDGPRVLSARLYGEAVSGSLDDVPFTQLPRLGGKTLLRGYPLDRFRDRVATLGSVEYAWDLSAWLSASTFVDAGRVYPSIGDMRAEDLRVGYGIAFEGHSRKSFLLRASLASSIDGGIFVDVAFDPVFDLDPRVERR